MSAKKDGVEGKSQFDRVAKHRNQSLLKTLARNLHSEKNILHIEKNQCQIIK